MVQAPDFRTHCHRHDVKLQLLGVLEPMCGLASSIRLAYIQEFFRFLLPMMQTCVSLLELCSSMADVVGVILELFVLVAENYTVFLDQVSVCRCQAHAGYVMTYVFCVIAGQHCSVV